VHNLLTHGCVGNFNEVVMDRGLLTSESQIQRPTRHLLGIVDEENHNNARYNGEARDLGNTHLSIM